MPRIARLIVYEGSNVDLSKHLAKARPEGIHESHGVKVTIIKLSQDIILDSFIDAQKELLEIS